MPNPVFISDEDLWRRLGGQDKLTQLCDPTKSGTWDATTTEMARRDACNVVLSAAGVQADLGGLSAADFASKFPDYVTYACWKTIPLVWMYSSSGQAMPEWVAAYDAQATAQLELLATRRRKHGAADFSPQPSQEVRGSIDNDPDRTRMTLSSWRSGFC